MVSVDLPWLENDPLVNHTGQPPHRDTPTSETHTTCVNGYPGQSMNPGDWATPMDRGAWQTIVYGVPSPTGLPSKGIRASGPSQERTGESGVSVPRVLFKSGQGNWGLSACGTTHGASLKFPSEAGFILRCAGKAGDPSRQRRGIDSPVAISFANKRPSSQGYGFSYGHVWM